MRSALPESARHRPSRTLPALHALAAAALALAGPARDAAAVDLAVDRIQELDPPVRVPVDTLGFSADLLPLWLDALDRSDAEPRRLALDTITLAASRGMEGLGAAVPKLEAILVDDPDPLSRRAAAAALVAIDSAPSAPLLARAADRDGSLVGRAVEPALARWDHAPRREAWLAALDGPPAAERLLAIEALGTVREPRAGPALVRILLDRDAAASERLAAARAAGAIGGDGLPGTATDLAGANGTGPAALPRLLAVALLAGETGDAATSLLSTLARDPEPAVATGALARLDAIDPAGALAIARESLAVPDAGQRLLAARIAIRPGDADAVGRLAPLLDDRNPTLRRFVAGTFADLAASPELRDAVIGRAMEALGGERWRELEQAALLVGHLDHEPAADRLLELLDFPRDEVGVAAAWALRKLEVEATLAPLLARATDLRGKLAVDRPLPDLVRLGLQAQQIHQLFGILRYRPADALLREYVPKAPIDANARSAALWALGLIHENEPDCDLAPLFAERLADVATVPPEWMQVRWMSAVGLGRLKAASQLDTLRRFAARDTMFNPSGIASHWAIERITGEPMPPTPESVRRVGGWFLEPP